MARVRIRELLPNLHLGDLAPGPLNSITDVPHVLVSTIDIRSEDHSVNTGITTILPRREWLKEASYASVFSFNGCGELIGSHWLQEAGLLMSPIVLTNSISIGAASQGVHAQVFKGREGKPYNACTIPVVGETFDGYLNDLSQLAQKPEHAVQGIETASRDRVKEGNVGGGSGMICYRFKGGTGSSSRLVPSSEDKTYTVGVLVQANHGYAHQLRIGGVPVGRILAQSKSTLEPGRKDGSIIIVVATDAPLSPTQLQRLAKRATVGMARVGGQGNNTSGDIFLAFSTGNAIPLPAENAVWDTPEPKTIDVKVLDDFSIDRLFEAVADATEEAIYNALCMAETMVGFLGRKVEALPLDEVKEIMLKYL